MNEGMFEMFDRKGRVEGKIVKLAPFADDLTEHDGTGFGTVDLIDTLDRGEEHTDFVCAYRSLLGQSAVVYVWRCDCFKEESGKIFYEMLVVAGQSAGAGKADGHHNLPLMLGGIGVPSGARWHSEAEFIARSVGGVE